MKRGRRQTDPRRRAGRCLLKRSLEGKKRFQTGMSVGAHPAEENQGNLLSIGKKIPDTGVVANYRQIAP